MEARAVDSSIGHNMDLKTYRYLILVLCRRGIIWGRSGTFSEARQLYDPKNMNS